MEIRTTDANAMVCGQKPFYVSGDGLVTNPEACLPDSTLFRTDIHYGFNSEYFKFGIMNPIFFESPAALRAWFDKNHATQKELLVGYYKISTGRDSVTWSQSVDEALCFGWIDGIRRSIDDESYCIRFTPRKPSSIWSAVNIRKVEELTEKGKMMPEGIEAYSKRNEKHSRIYSYETPNGTKFTSDMENLFKLQPGAWEYFQSQAPSYRKVTIRWVMGAKQEATRLKRLGELILSSGAGEWIKAMRWGKK
jgi:uncharacterized protein YdeI (YjbR/CyaY-like superfamily)